jgi:membrane protein YdbS with pleckstrin-like domain
MALSPVSRRWALTELAAWNATVAHGAPEMWLSRLLAGAVVLLIALAGIGSLAVLALNALAPTTVAVLVLVVVALVAMSAVGARSRRRLSNPYW